MEARKLISMLKKALVDEVYFPNNCSEICFDVVGETSKDIFVINIYRGTIKGKKFNVGARIKKNNIVLLQLHINPTAVHTNPETLEKIKGSHWHIYSEKYGRLTAYPADDVTSDEFVENTILFLDKFNVIEKPTFKDQLKLI